MPSHVLRYLVALMTRTRMSEKAAMVSVCNCVPGEVLDLIFTLANRDNDDDPLVVDARLLVAKIEQVQGLEQ